MRLPTIILIVLLAACSTQAPPTCEPARDSHGRIARDRGAVREFKRTHICPGTGRIEEFCYGYVVDHIVPLCACGPDRPDNMQYQSIKAAREKDKSERQQCASQ